MSIIINGTTGISGVDGTAGTPSLQGNDTNTGIVFGTDTVGVSTGGVQRTTVDSSGRLLVGTSTSASAGIAQYARLQVVGNSLNDTTSIFSLQRNEAFGDITSGEELGAIFFADRTGNPFAQIVGACDGTTGAGDYPGRLSFSTTADGASSPTERMRITQAGNVRLGSASAYTSEFFTVNNGSGTASEITAFGGSGGVNHRFYFNTGVAGNAAGTVYWTNANGTTGRSINAGGTINASGADYAEYMVKAGDFIISKGDVCGVNADGLLTLEFSDAISFVVKSTSPSYVGNDGWGVGYEEDADGLEAARQKVDRIAFAGQVPVNVMGATSGQYIVPVATEDGGITGIAKNEADLTLTEYMQAVGKVIAIEDDGRARIIVKVA